MSVLQRDLSYIFFFPTIIYRIVFKSDNRVIVLIPLNLCVL